MSASPSSSSVRDMSNLPPLRVLTLGDGNFSFSAAIVQMHQGKRVRKKKTHTKGEIAVDEEEKQDDATVASTSSAAVSPASATSIFTPSHRMILTATSYDSAASLHAKYPEAGKLIEKIRGHKKEPIHTIWHDVDATQLDRTLKQRIINAPTHSDAAAVSSSSIASAAASAASVAAPSSPAFDVIIFNHPHSGCENLALHGSLLAHFFHSTHDLLSSADNAQVHVTLCMKQPEDWCLVEHAWRREYRLLSRSEFLESHYPSYETKRHHVNKTFRSGQTIQRMELFVFRRKTNAEKLSQNPLGPLYTSTEQDAHFSHNLMSHVIPLPAFMPTRPYRETIDELLKDTTISDGPVTSSTLPSSSSSASSIATPSLLRSITCSICNKGFTSERGLYYHGIDAHQLQRKEGDHLTEADEIASEQSQAEHWCRGCDPHRSFKSAIALEQHHLARHTAAAATTAPTPAATSPTHLVSHTTGTSSALPLDSTSSTHACPICPLTFPTHEALSVHLAGGVPPIDATLIECDICGRVFSNQRGLTQHQAAMLRTPELHIRINVAPQSTDGDANSSRLSAGTKMKKLRGMIATQQQQQKQSGDSASSAPPVKHQSVVDRLGVRAVPTSATIDRTPDSKDSS